MNHVLVGAGPAGVIAAETLRKADPHGKITLVGDESEPPYARMAIPYYLSGRIEEAGTYLRKTDSHFDDLGIERVQSRVASLAPAEGCLTLDNGESLSYDRLLIATGAHPTSPPVEGLDLPGVQYCWTLNDARNIARLVQSGSEVVLIGAGFVACIILQGLVARGARVTVLVRSDRMLRRMMNETAGNIIRRWCENKGVRVLTHTNATAVRNGRESGSMKVSLDNGEELDVGLVVVAIGVNPNIDFLAGSGIETDEGILVNDRLQTSIPNIYAAGDVAQGRDFSTGGRSVQAIQPTAADHGRIAALNMAGTTTEYQGSLNMNVLDTVGLISSSFGLWAGTDGGDYGEITDEDNFKYLNLQFEDDVLVGANSIGLVQHVGVLRGLIQTRLPLGIWKERLVKDPTRVMEAYLGATQLVA